MDFDHGYEKIALSKQDYSEVFDNVLRSAMDKLNLHLPASGKDPLKNDVSAILEEFLVDGFDSSKFSVLADGRDLDDKAIQDVILLRTLENVEQIDPEVTSTLRNVLQDFETETVEVTKWRREAPIKASDVYRDVITKVDEQVSEIVTQIEKDAESAYNETKEPEQVNEEESDETSKSYNEHLELLEESSRLLLGLRVEVEAYNTTFEFLNDAYKRQSLEVGNSAKNGENR
ncbi:hypothetical protein Cantr_02131 [Candida viswanathii]|uniref:Uncharacterized protein n=1 Tax=Candida viswanathii TaxID=5486 RepID=A0A367YKM6_9ASCO|nr:hypothetical protein Cantr_02131 [Candida viswanathii]